MNVEPIKPLISEIVLPTAARQNANYCECMDSQAYNLECYESPAVPYCADESGVEWTWSVEIFRMRNMKTWDHETASRSAIKN
jgi:hypothetical protein